MDKRLGDRPAAGRTGSAPRKPAHSKATLPFVGRADELQRLGVALGLAAEGKGSTVLLTGQPGIGKTRLAREALALARDRGFTVLEGRAYSLRAGLAYSPLLDAYRPLLSGLDSARLAVLVSGLSDLGRLFGSLSLPAPEPLGDHALEKTRLFEAMLRLLDRLAGEAPVVLFVDDLQWADPASLELFHYLAYGMAGHRAMLLATCSADALESCRGL